MNDLRKTKAQLATEVALLRSRVVELETAEAARQRAEDALHQSEASLRALLNAVDDSMMLLEPDGTVVAANAVTAERLDTDPTTMIGRNIYDFLPAEVMAHRRQYVAQTIATGEPARFIDERRTRTMDNSINPIKDELGRVVRLAIFGRDITVHTQTETALRQAVVKYQMLFNNFPLGITISDRTGRIIETNQVAEVLLGVPQSEHTQRNIAGAEWRLVRPDGTPMPPEEYASVRALKENRRIENVEMGIITSPTETTWLSVTAAPLPFSDGGVVITFGDITSRKQAEAQREAALDALRRSEASLRAIFENSVQSFMLLDRDRRVQALNRMANVRASAIYNREIYPGNSIYELIQPEDRAAFDQLFEKVLAGESVRYERLFTPHDTPVWYEYHCAPVRTDDGQIIGTFLSTTDITERKLAEAAVRESELLVKGVLDSLTAEIAVLDEHAVIVTVNAAWQDFARDNDSTDPVDFVGVNYLTTCEAAIQQGDPIAYQVTHGIRAVLAGSQAQFSVEYPCDAPHQPRWFTLTVLPLQQARPGVVVIHQDVTARKRAEAALQARLRLSHFAETHTLAELLQRTLDEAEVLTGSQIGFFHFLEADQQTLSLQMWSTNTLQTMCTAEGMGQHYPVGEAGVWVDCIAARQPVIHNDYDSLPHRKGMPAGHAPVKRELVAPVIRNDIIVAILGIGNKVAPYNDQDARDLLSLADLAWDVVLRKRTEDALRANRDYLQAVLDSASDAIFVDDADTGQTIDVNQRMCELYGYTREEALRTPISDLSHGEPPYSQADALTWLARARELGPQTFEWLAKRKDGHLFWAEVSIRFALFGHAPRFVVSVRDISERKHAEEALRDSETRFRLAFDTSPDAVNINRLADGLYVDINQGFTDLTGFTREDTIGKTSAQINIWHKPADRQKLVLSLQNTGYCENLEAQFQRKDGSVTTALMSARVIALQGQPHILSITRDISERKRAEEALRASERQLRLIADNMPAIVNYVDAKTLRYRFVNRGYAALFGLSPEQIVGKQVSDIMDAAAYRQALPYIERARAGEHVRYENRLQSREGPRWFSISYEPDLDERGIAQNIIVLAVDITERKQATEQIKRYEFIANAATECMTLINRQHVLEAVNDAYCRAQGRSRAELIGRSLAEVWGEARYHDRILPHIEQCFAGQIVHYEATFSFADSGPRVYQVGMYPYAAAADGSIMYAAVVTFDITERKLAEQAERQARQLAEALRDTATALNGSLDLEAVLDLVLVNIQRVVPHDGANIMLVEGNLARVARVFGRCSAESIGAEQHIIADTLNLSTMRASGEPCIIDHTRDNPDWHTVPGYEWIASYAGVPIYASGDQLLGYLGLYSTESGHFSSEHTQGLKIFAAQAALAIQNAQLHTRIHLYADDLEERVLQRTRQLSEANAQLSELDRLKDDFISRISHELRTPLTSIKIYLELLESGKPEKRAKYLQTLNEQTARLQQLIESLLEVTQQSVNVAGLHLAPIDLNHLAASLIADAEPRAALRSLRLNHTLAPALPFVSADTILLTQALVNLVTNAINYTPPGGTIDLSTAQVMDGDTTWITITVQDTGPGITPADLPHIFERFYRGRAAADYKTPGTGVGLFISRNILTALEGRLTVRSEGKPGHGAVFTAWLKPAA